MRVLVTGVDGFVGSHAAEFLLAQPGTEVHGTIIGTSPSRNLNGISVPPQRLHQVDILDATRTAALLSRINPDRILPLAGQAFVPASLSDPLSTFQANILGGMHI